MFSIIRWTIIIFLGFVFFTFRNTLQSNLPKEVSDQLLAPIYFVIICWIVFRFIWLPLGLYLIRFPPYDKSDIASLVLFMDSGVKRRRQILDSIDLKIRNLFFI